MEVNLLSDSQARVALLRLTADCDQAHWAVAWATGNELVDAAVAHPNKFKHLVVGTHLYQTDPDVLKRLSGIPTARAVPPSGAQLFHPKVYVFRCGALMHAVVGSHNLTYGAMHRNVEASVRVTGSAGDPVLSDLLEFIEGAARSAGHISEEFLYGYRHQWQVKQAARESLQKFVPLRMPDTRGTARAPQEMSWARYLAEVSKPRTHGLDERLRVLAEARRLFASGRPVAAMTADERKLIAGTLGRKRSVRDGTDFALFGSMGGSGTFAKLVAENSAQLSQALDQVPSAGPVTVEHYAAYVHHFRTAFSDASRTGALPTASRLLAMKRPDTFVCVDQANREDLCKHFGVASSTTDIDNYWKRIVEPMMQAEWWLSTIPEDGREQDVWRGRAALLDAIYYTPKK